MDIPSDWIKCSYLNKERWYYYKDDRILHIKGDEMEYVDQGIKKTRAEWNSWYDTSTGETIWRSEQIKDKEKKGMVFCSAEEASKEARKNKAYIENKSRIERNARLRETMRPVIRRQLGR